MLTKLIVRGEEVTFDEALDLAKKGEADIPYPFMSAIVAAIKGRQGITNEDQISVTDVIGCPRAKYIKAHEDYSEDPLNMMAAFRGQLLHTLLAKYAESEAIVETRTSRDYAGYTLWGTADSIVTTRNNGKYYLRDFKTTKKIPQWSPWTNHTQQTNLYRWLYELPAKDTDISVVYFDLNGGEVAERALKPKDKWTDEKVEEFLIKRFVPLAQAMQQNRRPLFKEVPADITSWMCAWCPVFSKCYNHLLSEPDGAPTFLVAARERGAK